MSTLETRNKAEKSVDKKQRYAQIIGILKETQEATAKEIAVLMYEKGYIPTTERNFSSPRLTELCRSGVVEVVDKKRCTYTGKTVAVYRMVVGQTNIYDFIL